MNTKYSGKGRPRLSDVGQKRGERDYDRELINSTKRAELGAEMNDDSDGFTIMVIAVAIVLIVGSWVLNFMY